MSASNSAGAVGERGPPRERERVRELPDERAVRGRSSRARSSPSISAARAPNDGSEERVDHDGQHEPAADREEVDDTIARCDRLVDRGVGLGDDHRHPAVETAAGKRRLRDASPAAVVIAVGHDHRAVADVEAQHVEPVSPEKRVRRVGGRLGQVRRVADHDHPQAPAAISNVGPSPRSNASSVGHGSPVRPRAAETVAAMPRGLGIGITGDGNPWEDPRPKRRPLVA